MLISVVTPCFNEEGNVENHFRRVTEALRPFNGKYEFEFIYTDNRSSDETFKVLKTLASYDVRIKVIRFSRNIGSIRAMLMGLSKAKGDAVILIQADLQDPPEVLPEFIQGWEEGFDIVSGQIQRRIKENWVLQSLRRFYYFIIDKLSEVPVPRNVGEFRLMSRRSLNALLQYEDYELYLRGAVAHIGFPMKLIPYDRSPRHEGESNAPLHYLFNFALNSFFSSSVAPIRAMTYLGIITASIGFLLMLYFIAVKIFFPDLAPQGIMLVAVLITFFSGNILLALGILGEYVRKIYIEVLRRPRGFISEQINF